MACSLFSMITYILKLFLTAELIICVFTSYIFYIIGGNKPFCNIMPPFCSKSSCDKM